MVLLKNRLQFQNHWIRRQNSSLLIATKTALTTVENKIPNVSNLVEKVDYDTKITETEKKLSDHNHDKYITISKFNTLAASVFNAILAKANLVTKNRIW